MSRGPEPAGRSGIGSSNSRFQPRLGTWASVRRHPLASIEAPIFLCRKIPLAAPFLKISVGSIGQKHSPCILEFDAGLVERGRGAIRTFPRVAAGIKTAIPASRIFTRRHSRCGSRSCPRARHRNGRANIRREHREIDGGWARAWTLSKRHRAVGTIPLPIGAWGPPVHMIKLTETREITPCVPGASGREEFEFYSQPP